MNKTFPWVGQFFDSVIFPFQKEISERLKSRFVEMKYVYAEMESQLRPFQKRSYMIVIILKRI